MTSLIELNVTVPENTQLYEVDEVGVGVGVEVAAGVGVNFVAVTSKLAPPHTLVCVGVKVGVGVGVGVGVSDGVIVTSQSNNASKSKVVHGSVVVVVVTQTPLANNVSSKSGQGAVEPKGPNCKQVPPKDDDKHHKVSPVE